jgi:hypothetical protein
MKKIFFVLVAASLWSCDDRFNFLSNYNNAPEITLTGTGNNTTTGGSLPGGDKTTSSNGNTITLVDSVKTSFKHGAVNYTYTINLSDPDNNITDISLGLFSGTGKLLLNNNAIPSSIPTNIGSMLISVSDYLGENGIIGVGVGVKDAFGVTSSIKLQLTAFTNMPPVASFTSAVNNVNGDPYQYQFDASKSYDSDLRFGGGLQGFEWTVNGVKLPITTTPIMNQVFPAAGGYQVSLVVYDNDGVKSLAFTQQITVK